jgi:hypothetical protein
MKTLLNTLVMLSCILFTNNNADSYPSYTGYSGAPGSKGYCAQCHGSGTGTIVVSGIPAYYQPALSYTIIVAHNGGSTISNFNGSTRWGTTTTVAGTFTSSTNTTSYSVNGYETGIHASINNFDTARYIWTAPASGSGTITFYISGLQGKKSGPSTRITVSSTELTSSVTDENHIPNQFILGSNYPNPFNPKTIFSYNLPTSAYVKLTIANTLGQTIAILIDGAQDIGTHSVTWDASGMPSGIYFYSIDAISTTDQNIRYNQTRKMVLIK